MLHLPPDNADVSETEVFSDAELEPEHGLAAALGRALYKGAVIVPPAALNAIVAQLCREANYETLKARLNEVHQAPVQVVHFPQLNTGEDGATIEWVGQSGPASHPRSAQQMLTEAMRARRRFEDESLVAKDADRELGIFAGLAWVLSGDRRWLNFSRPITELQLQSQGVLELTRGYERYIQGEVVGLVVQGDHAVREVYRILWDAVWYTRYQERLARVQSSEDQLTPQGRIYFEADGKRAVELDRRYRDRDILKLESADFDLSCGRLAALAWVQGKEMGDAA